MANLRPTSNHCNPLDPFRDVSGSLDAEALLPAVVHMYGHPRGSRCALGLVSLALQFASLCSDTGPYPSLLLRAVHEAEAQLARVTHVSLERRTA